MSSTVLVVHCDAVPLYHRQSFVGDPHCRLFREQGARPGGLAIRGPLAGGSETFLPLKNVYGAVSQQVLVLLLLLSIPRYVRFL